MSENQVTSLASPSRRDFIKSFVFSTASICGLRPLCFPSAMGELLPEPAAGAGFVRLGIADFPQLQSNGQTLRLGFTALNGSRPFQRPTNTNFYPLLITRTAPGSFTVVDANCTHSSYLVEAQGNVLVCPAHGSRFQQSGSRISGPASGNLKSYTTHLRENVGTMGELAIEVPRLGYSVSMRPLAPDNDRIELRFIARLNLRYRVVFRESLSDEWTSIPHARSAGDPLNHEIFSPTLSDTTARVWVARPPGNGFFSVTSEVNPI